MKTAKKMRTFSAFKYILCVLHKKCTRKTALPTFSSLCPAQLSQGLAGKFIRPHCAVHAVRAVFSAGFPRRSSAAGRKKSPPKPVGFGGFRIGFMRCFCAALSKPFAVTG